MQEKFSIGLDFGTQAVRVVMVNVRNGRVPAIAIEQYAEPVNSMSWLDAASIACRHAILSAQVAAEQVVGIGAVFSGETVLASAEVRISAGDWIESQWIGGMDGNCELTGAQPAPGERAGALGSIAAEQMGLRAGTAVAIARSDLFAMVPGCGVASPSTLVMVLNDDLRCLMNSRASASGVEGVAAIVENGILPGYVGYEFAPLRLPTGEAEANDVATIEATAFALRTACEAMRDAGVQVRRFVATGELARGQPGWMQVFADVLDARIKPAANDDPAVIGAAILGCIAAGVEASGYVSISQLIHAMAPKRHEPIYRPDLLARKKYDKLYAANRDDRRVS